MIRRLVSTTLLKAQVEVVCVGINDTGTRVPLSFGEDIGSEELPYDAVIEIELTAYGGVRGSRLAQPSRLFEARNRRSRFVLQARILHCGTEVEAPERRSPASSVSLPAAWVSS